MTTKPRIMIRQGEAPRYHGRFSETRLEQHQVVSPDGSTFLAELYHVLNVDNEPDKLKYLHDGTLNRVQCPTTGEWLTMDLPVVLHSPSKQLLLLVVNPGQRYEEIRRRIELLSALEDDAAPLPGYVLNFRTVYHPFGSEQFKSLLDEATAPERQAVEQRRLDAQRETSQSEAERLVELARDLDLRRATLDREAENRANERAALAADAQASADEAARLERWADELRGREDSLEFEAQDLFGDADPFPSIHDTPDEPTTSLRTAVEPLANGDLSDIDQTGVYRAQTVNPPQESYDDEKTEVSILSPYVDLGDEIEMLTSAEIEIIDDDVPPAPPGPGAFPRIVRMPPATSPEVREQVRDLPERAYRPLETLGADASADGLRPGQNLSDLRTGSGLIGLNGDRVAAHFMVESGRLNVFMQREPDAFIQLHRIPGHPLISVLLVARDESDGLLDELFTVLNVADPSHLEILSRMATEFAFEVHLYDSNRRRVQYLQYKLPLEDNVRYLIDQALVEIEKIKRPDFESACVYFCNDGFERIGAMKHNFHRDSFLQLDTPGAARLAISMVGYWSEPQNTAYLIENRSFPLVYFLEIQRRAIDGALEFGIFLPPELVSRALEDGATDSAPELLDILMERFAEVAEKAAEHELDSMAVSENWDKLLTACVDSGVPVDDRVKHQADEARRRSRKSGRKRRTRPVDLIKTSEYQRVDSIAKASNEDLRLLLGKSGLAPAASRELVGRGGETNILCVIESARLLQDDDLEATARFLAAGADAFEPALLIGLGRIHDRTVHMCALALAMAKRTEALPTLIELLHDSERSQTLPIRDIVAEYGGSALPEIFDAIEERGPTDELVEVLALISVEDGPEIIAHLRTDPSPMRLKAAQRMSKVRRRLGGSRLTQMDEEDR